MAQATGQQRRTFQPWLADGMEGAPAPFIEFRNVTKRYGAVTAVDDLSLSIYEREFFALLGPSGCGKTTLMRMLAGFEEVTEGAVYLDGQDLAGVPPYRRPVNMMFQSYALFPHMSVAKNIGFGLKQDGVAKSEIDAKVAEMLALVKLEAYGNRKPDQLSGGQRQRVALARSLAKQPKLLLLDEPLGALDRKLREETQFELIDLQERLGITFMIVTHDQEEAMTVADRIAVMDHGKIVQVDPPSIIYEEPNSRYVADFLGDINLLEGKVTGVTKGVATLERADGTAVKVATDAAPTTGSTAWFAARPEKLTISRKKTGLKNPLAGEVWDIAYLGGRTLYKVKLAQAELGNKKGSDDFVRVAVLNSHGDEDETLTWEEKVWVGCDPAAARLLVR